MWRLFIKGNGDAWKWWMRWLPVAYTFVDSGCLSDNCDDTKFNIDIDGCPCNNFHQLRKGVEAQGYKHVASDSYGLVFCDSRALVRNYHHWGR